MVHVDDTRNLVTFIGRVQSESLLSSVSIKSMTDSGFYCRIILHIAIEKLCQFVRGLTFPTRTTM